MPIMPRTSVSVTMAGTQARGAFFEGGHYQEFTNFDPVVARLITDTTSNKSEPEYDFWEWTPAAWDLINSIPTAEGISQRLVIIPAQYSAGDQQGHKIGLTQFRPEVLSIAQPVTDFPLSQGSGKTESLFPTEKFPHLHQIGTQSVFGTVARIGNMAIVLHPVAKLIESVYLHVSHRMTARGSAPGLFSVK